MSEIPRLSAEMDSDATLSPAVTSATVMQLNQLVEEYQYQFAGLGRRDFETELAALKSAATQVLRLMEIEAANGQARTTDIEHRIERNLAGIEEIVVSFVELEEE